jgi:uncharacterized protein YdhG (YjbR/CyaY superfamily)
MPNGFFATRKGKHMERTKRSFNTIDEYIATFPENIQALLEEVRATARAAAPEAEECISYQMPAFAQNGIVVYFAALKHHIGFYPTPSGIEAFKDEAAAYKSTKGALQFPLDRPLPLDLISKIVRFRVAENLSRPSAKRAKKKR